MSCFLTRVQITTGFPINHLEIFSIGNFFGYFFTGIVKNLFIENLIRNVVERKLSHVPILKNMNGKL